MDSTVIKTRARTRARSWVGGGVVIVIVVVVVVIVDGLTRW